MSTGIHHVTGITRRVQANVDFYAGFLGLRLVKRTGGFEDAEQLHLFYGDAVGSPGSLISFLVWQDGAPGRVGHGQVAEVALAVPAHSIGDWLTRAMTARVPVDGPMREFGETVLRLKDPDGITVKLVGAAMPAQAALPDPIAPSRLRAVTLFTEKPAQTREFLQHFGYRPGPVEGTIQRMISQSDVVDIRDATGFFAGIPGTGTLDHVAFRAPDLDALRQMRRALAATDATSVHDRTYFQSLYVREPAQILLEYATDGPGFTLDESPEALGQTLFVPPKDQARAQDLRVMLPQFALPGEERIPMRDLHFVHRLHQPDAPDGSTIVLLHGSGGSETDLLPLASRLAPNSALLGVRGRSTEEGFNRWFRRLNEVSFDQNDLRAEAEAFAGFIDEAVRSYGLDRDKLTFMGYSNGANLIGAILQLYPGVVQRAILLRSMQALQPSAPPKSDALLGSRVLMLNGAHDSFGRMAPALATALQQGGALVDVQDLPAGHELSLHDVTQARAWLG